MAAWTMLVMNNPEYFMGAIVCAKSLKEQNTIYPIILMVGEDLRSNLELLEPILLTIFDDIVIVPIIEQPVIDFVSKRQKELYGGWISKSFTKWNCLTLYDKKNEKLYDKVILLDVDMIFISNCDELFELNAPAGCFSQPWAYPYCRDGAPNPYIKSNKNWLSNKDIPHGATIGHKLIMGALINKRAKPTFVVGAFMVLLQPNIDDYNLLLEIIRANPIYGKNNRYLDISNKLNISNKLDISNKLNIFSISGADESSISLLYAHRGINFTHIHQKFAATLWKEQWVAPAEARAVHYFGKTKPWNMHVGEYPDLKIWWDIVDDLCGKTLPDDLCGKTLPDDLCGKTLPDRCENFRQIFYPEYEPNLLDIVVAEYELTKDIQKILVNYFTSIDRSNNTNKQKLWERAKFFTSQFLISKEITVCPYPNWSRFLKTEYNYENFHIARIFFNRWITEIKTLVANRIKIKPRQIKISILENEIACGSHIKIGKSRKIISALEKNEDITSLLIEELM